VEPGLIRTGFADAATGSMGGTTAGGPYASFDAAVAKAVRDNYERGPFLKLGGGPETVAATIERAITAERPRARYAVTPSAHLFIGLRRLLPDRAWDALVSTVYPRPGR
jgi:hypothetical protein